jgi:hypothetical protein
MIKTMRRYVWGVNRHWGRSLDEAGDFQGRVPQLSSPHESAHSCLTNL